MNQRTMNQMRTLAGKVSQATRAAKTMNRIVWVLGQDIGTDDYLFRMVREDWTIQPNQTLLHIARPEDADLPCIILDEDASDLDWSCLSTCNRRLD